ncbi:hypothetical protein NUM3379_10820 [Kineococcus sp. NUM-3379]
MSADADAAGAAPGLDALVGAALLGTARRPVDLGALPGSLADPAAALPGEDPAARLLGAAALATVRERAGAVPLHGQHPVAPAGAETRRVAGPAAAARLAGLLPRASTEDGAALLALWLDTAAAAGLLAPPALLPDLLEVATRSRSTAARVAAVAGERGRWLAAARPAWATALARHVPGAPGGPAGEDGAPGPGEGAAARTAQDPVWLHGAPAERRAWLEAVRARDPRTGREALAATWAAEGGEDREALLPLLADGLGPDDEPLLERALGDRRAAVRTCAAALLTALPGSTHGRRAAEVALRHVTPAPGATGPALAVTLPDLDAAGARALGVPPTPPGTGARQWQLRHLLASAPLACWEEALALAPEQVLALPVAGDLGPVLREAWAEAARTQHNAAWARALLPLVGTRHRIGLTHVLPEAERAAGAEAVLAADDGRDPRGSGPPAAEVLEVLSGCPAPWPRPLAGALLAWLRRVRRAAVWYDRPVVHLAGLRLPCDEGTEVDLREVLAALPEGAPLAPDVAAAADTLTFRRHLHEELR